MEVADILEAASAVLAIIIFPFSVLIAEVVYGIGMLIARRLRPQVIVEPI